MKKSTFVVVVVLALALCVPAVAFAALSPSSPMAIGSRSAAATCPNYADRNANGACDRHENGACPATVPTAMASATTMPHRDLAARLRPTMVTLPHPMTLPPLRLRPGSTGAKAAPRGGRGYTDADGDGVCDNYQDGACSGYVDADGDGICDNCAGAGANCPGYVDADGDGVCDNYGSGNGQGHGHGRHHGGGHGCAR